MALPGIEIKDPRKLGQFLIKNVVVFFTLVYAGWGNLSKETKVDTLVSIGQSRELRCDSIEKESEYTKQTFRAVLYRVVNDAHDFDDLKEAAGFKIYDPSTSSFRMVFVNKEYENRFGVTRIIYLGNLDKTVHGSKKGNVYREHDFRALAANGDTIKAIEPWENKKTGDFGESEFLKWTKTKDGNTYLYFKEHELIWSKNVKDTL